VLVKEPQSATDRLLPLGVFAAAVVLWAGVSSLNLYPDWLFPGPQAVLKTMVERLRSGRLMDDAVASLFRVSTGFLLAVAVSLPLGLWMGHHARARAALLPAVNFLRNLSPLAWITFAILWFPSGDTPIIFLIFLSSFAPIVLSVSAAVANIPAVYFQVARDYGLKGSQLLTHVTLPAIMPQFITALRVASGVSWLVVVAAEMLAGDVGLGFAVWDARNGLRTDLLMCVMIVIGLIGIAIDRALMQLTRMPSVRWGYER
jgi:NitT/TauT family transport system permease protein